MPLTMSSALRECLVKLKGKRSTQEITAWISKRYPNKWKAGTLRDHLYGGRVNHPLAYKHHPGQKKFIFDHGTEPRYELYTPEVHGHFDSGRSASEQAPPSWILIHSEQRYAKAIPDNPIDELEEDWRKEKAGLLWQWKFGVKLVEDSRPRTLLMAWKGLIFAEVTASVTHEHHNPDYDFSFRLGEAFEVSGRATGMYSGSWGGGGSDVAHSTH